MLYNDSVSNSGFIFALDIGTRSVIGILGKKIDNKINIEHIVTEFHNKRVMYNGQIHDIDGVAEVVKKVKTSLEEKSKCSLNEVSIAAAGRSLITHKTTIDMAIDPIKKIDKDLINSIEVEGIQKSKHEIENKCEKNTNYFCVGHTVMHYYIDDFIITNPIGHKGEKIRLDILSSFLPQIVIDSLYAVTSKLDLEVRYMTLEPIAAIEVAIPENTRLLNLALVDIGAGTSDIAITKDGAVIGYGMTSSAGDDITEEICKNYLLDFDTAENLKINLSKEKVQKFSDIVGIQHEIESEEILKKIEPAIKKIANLIVTNIIEQNGKSPSAVFLIGGGSQIPYLNKFIGDELNIPKERVAVRGIENIKSSALIPDALYGPEYITPIGILIKSINNEDLDFIEIHINDHKFKMFQTKKLKVKDALVLAGFNPRNLIPNRGRSINIKINSNKKVLYGQYGEAAKILINGKVSNIESEIKDKDIINIQSAEDGQPAKYDLSDILPVDNKIWINQEPTLQIYNCLINNKKANKDTLIKDKDNITYCIINTVNNLCHYMNINYDDYIIKINGQVAALEDLIKNEDKIDIKNKKETNNCEQEENIYEKDTIVKEDVISIKYNDGRVQIPKKSNEVIFVDIFDYIHFDRSTVKGKLVLLINGRNAKYTDVIKSGDEIKVYWDK